MKKYAIISLFLLATSIVSCNAGGGNFEVKKIGEINIEESISCIHFSPSCNHLLVTYQNQKIKLIEIETGSCKRVFSRVRGHKFSPCGKYLFVRDKGFIGTLINLETMGPISITDQTGEDVFKNASKVEFSPFGNCLFVINKDNKGALIDLETEDKEIIENVYDIYFPSIFPGDSAINDEYYFFTASTEGYVAKWKITKENPSFFRKALGWGKMIMSNGSKGSILRQIVKIPISFIF
jgi:WD40 repeat protein